MRVDWGNYYNFLGEKFQSLEDGAKWREDGFSNISPFVSIGRSEMTVYWGNSRPDGIDEYVPYSTKAHIMPIIGKTANSVWGIRQQAKTVEIFRFYKKQMLLYRIISSVGLAIAEMDGTLPSMASIHITKCEAATP